MDFFESCLFKNKNGQLASINDRDNDAIDNWEAHKDMIEERCRIAEREQHNINVYPVYVADIKCLLSSSIYRELQEYLCVIINASKWYNWLQKKCKLSPKEALDITCKYSKKIAPKYLKWWDKVSTSVYRLYFSEKMMRKSYGIVIKSLHTSCAYSPSRNSCDVSLLVHKSFTTNMVILSPGNIALNVGNIGILPPFPTDKQFTSTCSAKLLNKGWIVKLQLTKRNTFQLQIRYEISSYVKLRRNPNAVLKICGIDLGVSHFATVFDPTGRSFCINIATRHLFKKSGIPNKEKLLKLQRQVSSWHLKWIDYLVKNYSLIVIGNLSLDEDDYYRNYTTAIKMEAFQHTQFRNLLIKRAFPRQITGCTVIVVDEYRTSKICSNCRYYDRDAKYDYESFTCKKCANNLNRDLNAAKNILYMGLCPRKIDEILQCS